MIELKAPSYVELLSRGRWWRPRTSAIIPNPMTGKPLMKVADPAPDELGSFADGLLLSPKSGLHNPLKNVERYRHLGDVTFRAAEALADPQMSRFFAKLIQSVMPKSDAQCAAEVLVTQRFLQNFAGDNIRFMMEGFSVAGDHLGQESRGYRWPYGPVAIVAPFNFPLEIPALQLMGALYGGNRPVVKVDSRVAVVMERFVRLLIACGLQEMDLDLLCCSRESVKSFMETCHDRMRLIQFTGSTAVAEWLATLTRGKVRIEDAGYDWKILGPDYDPAWLDYVAWQCDQDAYAASGQKCSAQSLLLAHENWVRAGLFDRIKRLAEARTLGNLTIGPVLTWTTEAMLDHVASLAAIPGARVACGGTELESHSIPKCYGAIRPTAVYVPIEQIQPNLALVTTEVFGPVQVLTTYRDSELHEVRGLCESIDRHLTAAIVSKDPVFINRILGSTVNGTTYAGMRARTTGAPQNHWFGPAGDPRSAGIGTPRAIRDTWTCHREIVHDVGPVPFDWTPTQS
jgi:1-pyrroline-5-carboxylate dehydrogenase